MATYTNEQLSGMTVKALTALAKKESLPVKSKDTKKILIAALDGVEVSADRKSSKKKLLKKTTPAESAKKSVKKAHTAEKKSKPAEVKPETAKKENKKTTSFKSRYAKVCGHNARKLARTLKSAGNSSDDVYMALKSHGSDLSLEVVKKLSVGASKQNDMLDISKNMISKIMEG